MKNFIWVVVVVVVLAGGYWFINGGQSSGLSDDGTSVAQGAKEDAGQAPQGATSVQGPNATDLQVAGGKMGAVVSYDGTAFTPAEVTIKKGQTVTFESAGAQMWVASAMHPDHTGYAGTTLKQHCPDTAGTAFDQCATGATYIFTFDKVGTWPYHNHVKGGAYGKVIVTE